MSTAGEEHHRSQTARHIVMGLAAGALALTAAYLWLSDGNKPWRFTLRPPAPSPAAAAAVAPPADHSVVMVRPTPAPARPIRQAEQPALDAAESASAPVDQAVSVDAQVAADAAAVGMTARVRPSPGQ